MAAAWGFTVQLRRPNQSATVEKSPIMRAMTLPASSQRPCGKDRFLASSVITLARMKLHTGSQSGDEYYRQNHCGDHPSPAAFDLRHLQFAAGDARAAEQRPHPCQPGFPAK